MLKSTVMNVSPSFARVAIAGLKIDLDVLNQAIEDEDAEGIRNALDDVRGISDVVLQYGEFFANKFDNPTA